MIDTCQANTLYSKFYSPNILATGSSEKDENSYSVRAESAAIWPSARVLISVVWCRPASAPRRQRCRRRRHRPVHAPSPDLPRNDQQDVLGDDAEPGTARHFSGHLARVNLTRQCAQFDTFSYGIIHSNAGVRSDLFGRPLNETLLTDFFGGVSEVHLSDQEHVDSLKDLRVLPAEQDQAVEAPAGSRPRRSRRTVSSGAADPSTPRTQPMGSPLLGLAVLGAGVIALQVLATRLSSESSAGRR